jgi:hypothetical protein
MKRELNRVQTIRKSPLQRGIQPESAIRHTQDRYGRAVLRSSFGNEEDRYDGGGNVSASIYLKAYMLVDDQKAGCVDRPVRLTRLREHDYAKHRHNRSLSRLRGDSPRSIDWFRLSG